MCPKKMERGRQWEVVEVAMAMVIVKFVMAQAKMEHSSRMIAKDVTVKESAPSVMAQAKTRY